MPSTTASIVISAASAVGKTFLIGAVGYVAVKRPKGNPYLPISSINMLSRLSFNILLLPLIYTGVASSVTLQSLSSLWPVVIASFVIILTSFLVSTILAYLPFFRIDKEEHFDALRTAICFPNIVAIPILIFPALCEYQVFHEFGNIGENDDGTVSPTSIEEDIAICEAEANAVVFAYFFGFSILFWSLGDRSLRALKGRITNHHSDIEGNDGENRTRNGMIINRNHSTTRTKTCHTITSPCNQLIFGTFKTMKDIIFSPGFIVLIVSFITACIQPLQNALFEPGGILRVIGSTLEALSSAGATFATMVVAAALADDSETETHEDEEVLILTTHASEDRKEEVILSKRFQHQEKGKEQEENDILSVQLPDSSIDYKNGSSLHDAKPLAKNKISKLLGQIINHPTFKVQIWHILSRLIVTPAVVFGMLLKVDCSFNMSPIARLILLVNSALPGALIVVVILKAQGLTKAASIVSQTYLPSYTLSVITIAVWASIGMLSFSDNNNSCT